MATKSKYKPEYCEKLIGHMTEGLSFQSFAGLISVDRKTLYNWLESHKDFEEAHGIAIEKARLFLERKGLQILHDKTMNAVVWIYTMKCRFPDEWGDKITDKKLEQLSPSEIKIIMEHFASLKGEK